MNIEGRIDALKTKHATLDEALLAEQARKSPNDTRVTQLKRDKLRIKDEIERLRVVSH